MSNRNRNRNHRRRHRGLYGISKDFNKRRLVGWGFNLYRNVEDGKISGVSAGMADYWDVEAWLVRILWVGLFLFTGTLAFWLYVGAWIVLAPRPSARVTTDGESGKDDYDGVEIDMEYDERHHRYRRRKVFRYSDSTSVRLDRARERLDSALRRVEDMESYVTSRRYNLNKEFSNL
jgi:phage shock protein C